MKRTLPLITAGLAVTAVSLGGASLASADTVAPDDAEQSSLVFSRQEEKMAHDLYTAFGAKYDSAIWDRIATSEQRHFDAVGRLLDQFGVTDPTEGDDAGKYDDATLQGLYNGWLDDGQESEDAAFKAAIELEKRDIADLEKQIVATDNDDIKAVYERLLAGSENHLAGFTRWLNGEEGTGVGPANTARRGTGTAVCDGTGMTDADRGNADAPRDGSGDRMRDGSGSEDAPRRGMNRGNA